MTYLEIVNKVLRLLRENTVSTLQGQSDVVVNLVSELVNDAKRQCEEAHNWNQLRQEWEITTIADTDTYSLTNASKYAKIEHIVDSGVVLKNVPLIEINKKKSLNMTSGRPLRWSVSGVDANNDVSLKFFPIPDQEYTFTVYGFERQGDLVADDDAIKIPEQPVVYLAYALAARERGEVGGQAAIEIFSMASKYLSDAIARDADMASHDFVWYTS